MARQCRFHPLVIIVASSGEDILNEALAGFTNAFVGYGPESETAVLELTHNWDTESYELGNGYGHVAVSVPDAYAACQKAKAQGGVVIREAGPMKHGTTVIAFLEDPDGYKIELIERK